MRLTSEIIELHTRHAFNIARQAAPPARRDVWVRISDDERAAIEYADAMTGNVREDVTDEQVADLERRFGQAGLVELTYNIALENMRARMNSALGIHDQGFSTDACRVPWADQSAAQGSTSSPTGPGFQATSQRKPSGSEK